MPTVYTDGALAIRLNARNEHNPPHVHVYYAEHAVRIEIVTGSVIDDPKGFPKSHLAKAQAYIKQNRETLLNKWNQLNPNLRG